MAQRFLKLPEVRTRVALSRPSIYAKIKEGIFPKQVSQGARAVAWLESDIEAWIEARIAVASQPAATEDALTAASAPASAETIPTFALLRPAAPIGSRQWRARESAITRGRR